MYSDEPEDLDSPALQLYSDQLETYMEGQGDAVEALRTRSQPHDPWPEQDNPMLGYLMTRAAEIAQSDGIRSAIVWASVHAWFEGALEERAKVMRSLTG